MRVDLVSTGDEILNGEAVDTNSALAASLLLDHGFSIGRHHTCGDDLEDLTAVIRQALLEADAVICCGGLGPTRDDRTAEAAARVVGAPLETHTEALQLLRSRLEDLGVPVTPNQEKQARLPAGARVFGNQLGTAPGFEALLGQKSLFCLPGPPAEFRPLLEGPVVERLLAEKGRRGDSEIRSVRILRVFGKGEGWVEHALGDPGEDLPGLTVGFQAVMPEIHVKLRAKAESQQETAQLLDRGEQLARERLGHLVYATGQKSLAATVLDILSSQSKTLSCAESCTGGLVGKLLTDVPGSSRVFTLSAVTYANDMKQKLLNVPGQILRTHGAVSEECARAMAEGVRSLSGSDLSVAVTGIAGPEGGTPDKPVGTICFAVSDQDGTESTRRVFPFRDRAFIRSVSAHAAMALVRRRLIEGTDQK